MSNPFDPNGTGNSGNSGDPANSGNSGNPGGFGANSNGSGSSNGNFPQFGATSHPEDQPGFGKSGYGGYDSYGVGAQNQGQGRPGYAGMAHEPLYGTGAATAPSDGKIHVMDAISWGFKMTFKNAGLWIVGMLVYVIIGGVLAWMSEGNNVLLNVLSWFIGIVIGPLMTRLALYQVDVPATGWRHVGKDVPWGMALAVSVTYSILSIIVFGGAFYLLAQSALSDDTIAQLADPDSMTESEILSLLGAVIGAMAIIGVVYLLVYPLFMFITTLPVDRRTGFVDSFAESVRIGAKNYVPLLGFVLLIGIIVSFGTVITIGIGVIVLAPAALLSTTHVYRQAVGGPVPVTRQR